MENLQIIASALGISVLAGIRLYATVFALGLVIRFGWLPLPESLHNLTVLADTRILIAAGIFVLIEFFADKVPWLDSAWDAFHTFIRPIGAVLLTGALSSTLDPSWQIILMLLGGTVALSGHAAKTATRLAVNHSPEPFTNALVSVAEDVAVPAGVWLTTNHPWVMGGFVVVFLLVFIWLAPKIWRAVRVEFAALSSLLRSWWRSAPEPITGLEPRDPFEQFLFRNRQLWDQLPTSFVDALNREKLSADGPAVRCVGSTSVRASGLIGYLVHAGSDLVFVRRGLIGTKLFRIPVSSVRSVTKVDRFFLDDLIVETSNGSFEFDLFRSALAPSTHLATVSEPEREIAGA